MTLEDYELRNICYSLACGQVDKGAISDSRLRELEFLLYAATESYVGTDVSARALADAFERATLSALGAKTTDNSLLVTRRLPGITLPPLDIEELQEPTE